MLQEPDKDKDSPKASRVITVETHATSRVDYEQYIQKFRVFRVLIGVVLTLLRCAQLLY